MVRSDCPTPKPIQRHRKWLVYGCVEVLILYRDSYQYKFPLGSVLGCFGLGVGVGSLNVPLVNGRGWYFYILSITQVFGVDIGFY